MSATEEMLRRNRARAAAPLEGSATASPRRRVAVLTCMDPRIDPAALLGLEPGDAHVLRNAGGVVTDDVLRSLAISQRVDGTEEVVLIHHTDCELQRLDDDGFREQVRAATGIKPSWSAEAFADLDADVRQSIARVEACPFLPCTDRVRGFVLDVASGTLREIA